MAIFILIIIQNISIYFVIVSIKNLFYNKKKRIETLGGISVIINTISVFSTNSKSTISNLSLYSPFHKSLFIFDNWWMWTVSVLFLFFSTLILFNLAKKWSLN